MAKTLGLFNHNLGTLIGVAQFRRDRRILWESWGAYDSVKFSKGDNVFVYRKQFSSLNGVGYKITLSLCRDTSVTATIRDYYLPNGLEYISYLETNKDVKRMREHNIVKLLVKSEMEIGELSG